MRSDALSESGDASAGFRLPVCDRRVCYRATIREPLGVIVGCTDENIVEAQKAVVALRPGDL